MSTSHWRRIWLPFGPRNLLTCEIYVPVVPCTVARARYIDRDLWVGLFNPQLAQIKTKYFPNPLIRKFFLPALLNLWAKRAKPAG